MADPKIPLEELIALRDGLQTTGNFRRALASDVEALKDLAEARLFALLMALPTSGNASKGGAIPQPEVLLRYLVNALPTTELKAVEAMVRGNAEALELLGALKDALFRPDVWRREAPVDAPEPASRIDLGRVRIAELPRNLGFFAILTEPGLESDLLELSLEAERSPTETEDFDALAIPEEFYEDFVSPAHGLLQSIEDISRAIEGMQEAVGELSRDIRRGIKARRQPIESAQIAIRALRRGMQSIEALLPLMEDSSRRLEAKTALAEVSRELERAREDAKRRAAAEAAALRDPRLDWPSTFTISQPELEIQFQSVDSTRGPALGILVRQLTDLLAPAAEGTIVEPGRRFTRLELGPDGMFVTAPPTSPVLLLIDTDHTYSIRLEPA